MDIYIGFDSSNYGQEMAFEVCKRSLLKYNPNLNIHKLVKKELEDKGIFARNDKTGTTEFTYTRFLVPYLNNYTGYALFCDSDFLWQCDVEELFNKILFDIDDLSLSQITSVKKDTFTVGCVQHEYTNCNGKLKMNGFQQEFYPRKNWSSLMLFNCEKCKNLSPDVVNTQTPKYLHRMEWCLDEDIVAIDKTYNYLVGYYNDIEKENVKAFHYTDGGPWHIGYETTEFADEWLQYISNEEKDKLIKDIGVKL